MKKRKNYMKTLLYIILICFMQQFHAQENSEYRIISSNLGTSGSSQTVVTSNGTYKISQSVGQSSVIGTHSNNGYVLRQGYQQPTTKAKATTDFEYNLKAKVYPNPFKQKISITFSNVMQQDISVVMYDIHGRIIHSQEFSPMQDLEMHIRDVANGTYFLKVLSGKKYFNTKLIKI